MKTIRVVSPRAVRMHQHLIAHPEDNTAEHLTNAIPLAQGVSSRLLSQLEDAGLIVRDRRTRPHLITAFPHDYVVPTRDAPALADAFRRGGETDDPVLSILKEILLAPKGKVFSSRTFRIPQGKARYLGQWLTNSPRHEQRGRYTWEVIG